MCEEVSTVNNVGWKRIELEPTVHLLMPPDMVYFTIRQQEFNQMFTTAKKLGSKIQQCGTVLWVEKDLLRFS